MLLKKDVISLNHVRSYLIEQGFKMDYNSLTFEMGKARFGFTREKLTAAMDGNMKVHVKKKDVPLSEYLIKYNWKENISNYPMYEQPTVKFNKYTREELKDDRKLKNVFWVMYSMYNKDDYQYLMSWVSAALNEGQTQSSPIIMGDYRIGKDATTTTLYYKLFEPWTASVTTFDDVVNHNSSLDYKRFVVLSDPSTVLDNRETYNNFKTFNTSVTYKRKEKYAVSYDIENRLNFIFTTNDSNCVHTTIHDTRIKFIAPNNRFRGKSETWNEYFKIINNKDVQDKLRFMFKNWKYNISDVRNKETHNSFNMKICEELNTNTTFKSLITLIEKGIKEYNNKNNYNFQSNVIKIKGWDVTSLNINEKEILEEYHRTYRKVQTKSNINWLDYPFVNSFDKKSRNINLNLQKLHDIIYFEPVFEMNNIFDYERDVLNHISFNETTPTPTNDDDDIKEESGTEESGTNDNTVDDNTINDNVEDTDSFVEDADDCVDDYDDVEDIIKLSVENFDTNSTLFELYYGLNNVADKYMLESRRDKNINYDFLNPIDYTSIEFDKEKRRYKRPKKENCGTQNMLFEFDTISIEEQGKLVEQSGIKPRRCVYSGNKSNHYIIQLKENYCGMVDADERLSFYKYLWNQINDNFFEGKADTACGNNNRLTRNPNGFNEKSGKPSELRYISKYVLKINNIDEIIKTFKAKEKKKSKPIRKNYDATTLDAGILERIRTDEDFAFVWNGNEYQSGTGTRNKLKAHFVGVCLDFGMTQEEIEPYIIKSFGNCDGENSISSLC